MTTSSAPADTTLAASTPGARPGLELRLLAVAFADQVGAALASSHPVGQS
jgi:hypothetical protein